MVLSGAFARSDREAGDGRFSGVGMSIEAFVPGRAAALPGSSVKTITWAMERVNKRPMKLQMTTVTCRNAMSR